MTKPSANNKDFNKEVEDLFAARLSILAVKIAVPINLLYAIYDVYFNQINQPYFVATRIIVSALTFVFWHPKLTIFKGQNVFWGAYILSLLFSVSISGLGILAGQNGLLYFKDGHLHVLFAFLVFLPWKNYKQLLIAYFWIYLGLMPFRIASEIPVTGAELVTKIGFDIFILILATYNCNRSHQDRYNEFRSRSLLNEEVKNREKIIDEKVTEIVSASNEIRIRDQQLAVSQQLADLAARVAHDIRSPLTALGVVTSDISTIPEDRRKLVQSAIIRINDIANSLLNFRKDREKKVQQARSKTFAIGPVLDRLVSEKRYEQKTLARLSIIYEESAEQFGAFLNLPIPELERTFSNLLNNAIEALNDKGVVSVSLSREVNFISVVIDDTGPGMSPDLLAKIGTKGFTSKQSGSGLGLFHAKEFIQSVGGDLRICSTLGKGTTVTVKLPLASPPLWFADKIQLKSNIVLVDDDASILELWQRRLPANCNVRFVTSPDYFEVDNVAGYTFLIDYEYRGTNANGLDLIEKYKLASSATLVTSRFEDESLLNRAQDLGVKVLPKPWISYVSIITEGGS